MLSDQSPCCAQAVAFRDPKFTEDQICWVSTIYAFAVSAGPASDCGTQNTRSSDGKTPSTIRDSFCPDLVLGFRRCPQAPGGNQGEAGQRVLTCNLMLLLPSLLLMLNNFLVACSVWRLMHLPAFMT